MKECIIFALETNRNDMLMINGYKEITKQRFSALIDGLIKKETTVTKEGIAHSIEMTSQSVDNAIKGDNVKNKVIIKVAKAVGVDLAIVEMSGGEKVEKKYFIKK